MKLGLFVRVWATAAATGAPGAVPARKECGTGYLIGPDLVLSAAHILGPADWFEIEYDLPRAETAETQAARRIEQRTAAKAWIGQAPIDAALLRLTEGVSIEVAPVTLLDQPLPTTCAWESKGWAIAGNSEERIADSFADLHGDASPFTLEQKRFGLTIEERLADRQGWQGASGAAVFERGVARPRLLGVLTQLSDYVQNGLKAVSMPALLADPEFRRELASNQARGRLLRLVELLDSKVRVLEPAAWDQLGAARTSWSSLAALRESRGLTRQIVEENVVDVLVGLKRALAALKAGSAEQRRAAAGIRCLVGIVASVVVLLRHLHSFPPDLGASILALPLATQTMAAIALDAIEGRPARLRRGADGVPVGAGFVPSKAEGGFDLTGAVGADDLARYLASTILTSDDRNHVARLETLGQVEKARKLRFACLEQEIAYRANPARVDDPYRHFLLFHPEFGRDYRAFLDEIKAKIPSLALVQLDGDDVVGEREVARALRDIFAMDAD